MPHLCWGCCCGGQCLYESGAEAILVTCWCISQLGWPTYVGVAGDIWLPGLPGIGGPGYLLLAANLGSELGFNVNCLCNFLWRFSCCCCCGWAYWYDVPTLSTLLLFDTTACWDSLGGGTLERVRPKGVFRTSLSLACEIFWFCLRK